MNKYLATDLDGTLLYPKVKDKYISEENSKIINTYFKNSTIIVSGRNSNFIKNVCKELDIAETFISCNGANIYLKGKKIFTSYLNNTLIKEIINYVTSNYQKYCFVFFDDNSNLYSLSEDNGRIEKIQQQAHKTYPKLAYNTIKDENLIFNLLNKNKTFIKMNITLEEDDRNAFNLFLMQKNYKLNYSFCNSSIEITSFNISKGNSLKRLTKIMNINDKDVMVIGDDKNDLSMFNHYENSFLVINENNKDIRNIPKHLLNKFSDIKTFIKEE